ncbi:MAG: phospholipase D-like domain-containing protein, partial [Nitrosopumilus sp.]|nr:phospholipase D-like domain-containing protein [Nitrosopumilus sp.]
HDDSTQPTSEEDWHDDSTQPTSEEDWHDDSTQPTSEEDWHDDSTQPTSEEDWHDDESNPDLDEKQRNFIIQKKAKRWLSNNYTNGNSVQFLIDGKKTFESMVDAIRAAKGSEDFIYFANWKMEIDCPLIPNDDSTTLENLIKAADNNKKVEIHALLSNDILGNYQTKKDKRNITKDHEKLFNSLTHGSFIADKNFLILGVHHQKLLIVKAQNRLIAFCGGVDFAMNRIPDPKKPGSLSSLHDVHCRIEGPAALKLLHTFEERWMDHPQKPKKNSSLRSQTSFRNRQIVTSLPANMYVKIGRTYGNGKKQNQRVRSVKSGYMRAANVPVKSMPFGNIVTMGYGAMMGLILAVQPKFMKYTYSEIKSASGHNYYKFAPDGEKTSWEIISHAILQAKKFIYLEEQYLISLEAAKLLNSQLRRNSRLKIIILIPDSRITTDLFTPYYLRAKFIETLTKGIGGYPNQRVAICYRNIKKPHNYVHSKTWIFDDEFAIIGSANCNNRGYTHDSEVVAGIFEPKSSSHTHFARDLRMKLWAEHLNISEKMINDPMSSFAWNLWKRPLPSTSPTSTNIVAVYKSELHIKDNDPNINPKGTMVLSTGQIDPRGD